MRLCLPLNLGLAHSENAEIKPGISKEDSPECVSFSRVRMEVEYLDSAVLIIVIPNLTKFSLEQNSTHTQQTSIHLVRSSGIDCCENDNDEDGDDHEEELKDVSPDDSLHAAHRGVEDTDDEDGSAGHIDIQPHDGL